MTDFEPVHPTADGSFARGAVIGTETADVRTRHAVAAEARTDVLRSIADRVPVFELRSG